MTSGWNLPKNLFFILETMIWPDFLLSSEFQRTLVSFWVAGEGGGRSSFQKVSTLILEVWGPAIMAKMIWRSIWEVSTPVRRRELMKSVAAISPRGFACGVSLVNLRVVFFLSLYYAGKNEWRVEFDLF